MSDLQRIIDDAFERRDTITPTSVDPIVREAVLQTIDMLDAGQIRVAEKLAGEWVVHQWVKKAVPKQRSIKNAAKLRRNQPKEEVAEEAEA